MLSKMFSGQMEPGLRDEQGRVYIDRWALSPGSFSSHGCALDAQFAGCKGLNEVHPCK